MATKNVTSTGLLKLLEDQLADTFYAEKQLLKALPKMAKTASNDELRSAFTDHADETRLQIERLEQVFASMDLPVKAKKCPAIDGILEEGKEIMEEYSDDAALDAGLIASAQKAEHYEIASYGSMCAWAEQLGLEEAVGLLNETLEEEKATDEKLTVIAETVVNIEAEGEDEEEEGEVAEVGGGSSRAGKTKSTNGKSSSKVTGKAVAGKSGKR